MAKSRIYISYPISGYDAKERRSTVGRIKAWLKAKKPEWEIVDPMVEVDKMVAEAFHERQRIENVSKPLVTVPEWSECMKRDLDALTLCDYILLLDGWEKSCGCNMELEYASKNGIKRIELVCQGNQKWPELKEVIINT